MDSKTRRKNRRIKSLIEVGKTARDVQNYAIERISALETQLARSEKENARLTKELNDTRPDRPRAVNAEARAELADKKLVQLEEAGLRFTAKTCDRIAQLEHDNEAIAERLADKTEENRKLLEHIAALDLSVSKNVKTDDLAVLARAELLTQIREQADLIGRYEAERKDNRVASLRRRLHEAHEALRSFKNTFDRIRVAFERQDMRTVADLAKRSGGPVPEEALARQV